MFRIPRTPWKLGLLPSVDGMSVNMVDPPLRCVKGEGAGLSLEFRLRGECSGPRGAWRWRCPQDGLGAVPRWVPEIHNHKSP